MLKIIPLNTNRDTVKRLLLADDGGGVLQHFKKAGRVEIPLTAEELEVVRTSCLIPDCDCTELDAQALDALAAQRYPSRGTLGEGQGTEYPQTIGESIDAIQRHLAEANPFVHLDLDSFILEERPDGTASPEGSRADRIDALYRSLEASEGSILDLDALRLKEHDDGSE